MTTRRISPKAMARSCIQYSSIGPRSNQSHTPQSPTPGKTNLISGLRKPECGDITGSSRLYFLLGLMMDLCSWAVPTCIFRRMTIVRGMPDRQNFLELPQSMSPQFATQNSSDFFAKLRSLTISSLIISTVAQLCTIEFNTTTTTNVSRTPSQQLARQLSPQSNKLP